MAASNNHTFLFRPGTSSFLLRSLCDIPDPSVREFSLPALKRVVSTALNNDIPHAVLIVLGDFRSTIPRNKRTWTWYTPKQPVIPVY